MKSFLFAILLVIPFIHYVVADLKLCGNKNISRETLNCSTQILGYDESDYEVCHLNFYPSNSEECKMMSFGPIEPNKHIGDVSLKPYILRSTLVDSQLKYSDNFTVLNITFTNIKWKTMKFRFQRYGYGQSIMKNHCRTIDLTSATTLLDQSVLYYDCYWSLTDGYYDEQTYMLDFEATDDSVVNRGQYRFTIPTRKMLSSSVPVEEWRPFTYVEIHTGTLKLHILPPPKHLKIKSYRVEVKKSSDLRTPCEEAIKNVTLKLNSNGAEVTYEHSVLGTSGQYCFVVTPLHEKCENGQVECQSVKSPSVFINNEIEQTTYICIASITSLIVASLFAYYIVLRLLKKCWEKEQILDIELPTPPKILVIYSATNKLHAECVASFVSYLRSEYGFQVMYDGDIAATSHADPYIWNQETFKIATHVIYIVGPADETNQFNIYDKPIISVHRNIDTLQLNSLKSNRFKKDVMNVFFEHSTGHIPIETCHDKVFFLLKDWQKLITYLSRNLLPKQQLVRTEKGRCLLDDLNRAKKLLTTKSNDVVIKLDNCKFNSSEKKVLL